MRGALGLAAAVVLAASLLAARPGHTSPAADWMAVTEVRPGMRGQARTVVRGTRVESFDVEALAVVPGGGPGGDLILIRASGPLVQRTGGIAAGMSGSPVFFDGRLAGAIGFGWAFADHTVGLVTPIADMLRSMPPPRADRYRLPHPVTASGRAIEEIAIVSGPAQGRALEAREPRVAAMVPLARPLLVSGLSSRAAQFLRTWFDPWDIYPIEGAAGASTEIRPPLEPGSAIGVQLLRGDLNAVAIGTLTYRQGDSIVAFGHPFLNRGRTGYLLTAASIHEVVRSTAFPFKVGSAGAPVGVVLEDRRAGIGGRLGVLPPMVGVRARVTDRDRGRTVALGTQVVRDPQVGPLLVLVSTIEAVDRALDRVGEGTARVRLVLRARGLDGPLVRENVFYHARDIGSAALLELPEALRLLFANEFVRTGPVDVTVEAEVEQTRKTASVVEAVAERSRLQRGETAVVRITLRPFQGQAEVRSVEVPVPQEFPLGQATLLVRAGGRPLPEQGVMALLSAEPGEAPAPSASAQVALFAERDRNTDVVVELIPAAARFPDGGSAGTVQPVRVRLTTPWVVRGRLQVPLTIAAP